MKLNQSCTHCGQCCLFVPCGLSQEYFKIGEDAHCPALEEENGLYYCGMIRNTAKYVTERVGPEPWKSQYLGGLFAAALGIGKGCDSGEVGLDG